MVIASWVLSCLAGASVAQESSASGAASEAERVVLATLPKGVELAGPSYVDPNGATRIDRAELVFDEAVTRVAFAGWRGARSVACIGGDVVGEFDYLAWPLVPPAPHPILFRAGDRAGKQREKWWIVRDGKKGSAGDWIGALACSPDGARVAWWEQPGARLDGDGVYTGGKQVLKLDGKVLGKFEEAESLAPPLFSADGSRVAAIVVEQGFRAALFGRKTELFSDGKRTLRDLAMAHDGSRLAWCEGTLPATLPPSAFASFEGLGMSFELVTFERGAGERVAGERRWGAQLGSCAAPVFSPDGASIACKYFAVERAAAAPRGASPFASPRGLLGLAVDGEARGEAAFLALDPPLFSPDGRRLAAAACLPTAAAAAAQRNAIEFVARDYDRERVAALVAAGHAAWHVWRDGTTGEAWDDVACLAFSPDGERLAWAGRRGGQWHVVVDGEPLAGVGPFEQVGPLHWLHSSAGGATLRFGALEGREIVRRIVAVAPR